MTGRFHALEELNQSEGEKLLAQKVQPLPREYQITEANQQTMSIPTPPSPPTASQSVLRRTNFTLSYGSLNTSRRFTRARSKKIRGLVRENATCFVPALAAMRRCRILRLRLCVTRCTPQPHLSNIYSCDYTAMHEGSTPPPPSPVASNRSWSSSVVAA